ncbi:hypothetical protein V5O48_015291 [Marasmius crinis-equi]|uniref:Dienelactone hydrolase domain-containing protein n=1 Tax=Marasmius crinis-equi TaxID=585013 RepID=A0ABR3EUX5_9AGAR
MSGSQLCDNCFKGVTHEGTPTGKWENIGGVDCYVALPGDASNSKLAVLFLPDAFGIQLINNQLLISDFAANGFKTVGVDYFHGDPVPADAVKPDYSGTWNRADWFAKHINDLQPMRETISKVIDSLKAEGVEVFGATGYCIGGRFTFDLAFENTIKVAATSHPSRLEVPADLEKYLSASKAPLLINSCTTDHQFPLEAQAQADHILGNGKFAPGYKREYFEGCEHGFAVRGDMSKPEVKAGKEGSFMSTVEWFKQYLKV